MRGVGEVVDGVHERVRERGGYGSAQEEEPHGLGDAPPGVLHALHRFVGLVNQLGMLLPRPLHNFTQPTSGFLHCAIPELLEEGSRASRLPRGTR